MAKDKQDEKVNKVGRPPKFKSVEELQKKIDTYFKSCHNKEGNLIRPYTITGLALALDTSRETLLNYEDKEGYFDTIKKAKLKCENFAEEQLFTSRNTAGVIFNMVNNYNWQNKQMNENKSEISGKDGGPIEYKDIDRMSDDELIEAIKNTTEAINDLQNRIK